MRRHNDRQGFSGRDADHGRSCWGCCCLIPWVPLMSCAVIAVGVPLWWIYSDKLHAGTMEALATSGIDQSVVDTFNLWTSRAHVAAVVLIAIAIAMAVITTFLSAANNAWLNRHCSPRCSRPGPRTLRCCMMLEGVVTLLSWLLALCFVALVAVYLTWVVLVYVTDGAINVAVDYAQDAQATLRSALTAGSNVLTTIENQFITALDQAPADIQQQLGGVRTQVQQVFDQQRALLDSGATTNTCNASCVDVSFLVNLGVVQDPCICATSRLQDIQAPLAALVDSRDAIPAVVGQLLLYIATSWLIMCGVGSFVKASRDLLHQRRIKELERDNAALASTLGIGGAPAAMAMTRHQPPARGMYKDLEGAPPTPPDTAAADDRALLQGAPSSSYGTTTGMNGHTVNGWHTRTNPIGAFSQQDQRDQHA